MPVTAPTTWMQVDLDIAGLRRAVTDLNDGGKKIRPCRMIPETRVKNPQLFAVQGLQFITSQTLVLPEALQEPFRWQIGRFP